MKYLNKNQKIIVILIIVLVFLASASFTYAYFNAGLSPQNPNDEIVTTGTLNINFHDGNSVNLSNLKPGDSFEKEIVITNTGTLSASYNLKWNSLTNEIINDEMQYSIYCRNYSVYNGFDWENYINNETEIEEEGNVFIGTGEHSYNIPITNNINASMLRQIEIRPQTIHACYIKFEFIETGTEQNYNQGKIFSGVLEVIDGREELALSGRLLDSFNNPISGATVDFYSDVVKATTDENGNYYVAGIVPGEYEMVVKDSTNQVISQDTININKSNVTEVVDTSTINYVPGEEYYKLVTKLSNSNSIESNEFVYEFAPESCFTTSGNLITDYNDDCPKAVAIPTTIRGTTITRIGLKAFYDNQLINVVIPDTVHEIAPNAFSNNQLIGITISDNVLNIGDGAFNNNKLPDEEAFIYARTDDNGDGINEIVNTYLVSYGGLNRSNVIIPNGVITIGANAFSNSQIANITIPNSVNIIGYNAFYNNQLTSVTIPNSVREIYTYAFANNNISSFNCENINGFDNFESTSLYDNPICSNSVYSDYCDEY